MQAASSEIYLKFGQRLKYLREKIGLTQRRLAQLTDLSTNFIALLEAGKRPPSFKTMAVLAQILQVPISKLMDFETQEPDKKRKGRKPLDYCARLNSFLFTKSEAQLKMAYEIIRVILKDHPFPKK